MANPLLQKARQRKMIYFGAIVALFTISLTHREFVVKPQAAALQLSETVKGDVELTSSAVRLMLTGSRGLAVTFLWYNAIEKQKRNEWNELELLVNSITKLQPYFITPWLYQSWNLSFNVSVECDRPHDKYYYISRGLRLLAEGERFNSGSAGRTNLDIPGNPELRHYMGFIYQLKIGNSDENRTMRSLFELSCIDPVERNAQRFWLSDKRQDVNLAELAKFAQKYPRLMRRLNEQLAYTDPQRIVQFLQDHQDIPSRFEPGQALATESKRKSPQDRFPIVPAPKGKWEDPQEPDFLDETNESLDVFLVCRRWYEYAQEPLPPPHDNPGAEVPDYNKLKYRVPKGMVTQLFRSYPSRAQVFIAETLEAEGFFDADGWDMGPAYEKWTQRREAQKGDRIYGTEAKYHSRVAWQRGHERYKDYGLKNGLYLSPGDIIELTERAALYRKEPNVKPDDPGPMKPEYRQGPLAKSKAAHDKLYYNRFYRTLSNFDAFFDQTEAEPDPITILMRKTLFVAERKRKRETPSQQTLDLYDQAWNLYKHACFKYPRFAQVSTMQEEVYDTHQKSLGLIHQLNRDKFRSTVVAAAKLAFLPITMSPAADVQLAVVALKEADAQEMNNVFPMRNRYGPLDLVHYYDGSPADPLRSIHALELKRSLFVASQTAAANALFPAAPALNFAAPSGHEYFLLTRTTPFLEETDPPGWQPLIVPITRLQLQIRMGLK